MIRKKNHNQKETTRRGILTMEFVMVMPILAVVLFALFEFSLLFSARTSVVEACRTGARLATVPGVQPYEIEAEVRRVLPTRLSQQCQVRTIVGENAGDPVSVVIQVPMQAASPDLLWPIGFGLKGQFFQSESRMLKE